MELIVFTMKDFWAEYGYSLIMLIINGILTALFIEYVIKQLFNSIESKAEKAKNAEEAKTEKIEKLEELKSVVCVITAVVLSIVLALCVIASMPLPGGIFLWPTWVGIVYFTQLGVSMYVIKRIQEKDELKKDRPKKERGKKLSVTVSEGEKVYRELPDGTKVEIK